MLYHDLKSQSNYGRTGSSTSSREAANYGRLYEHQFAMEAHFVAPQSFLVVLDMDEGTLAYMANGQYLGLAFTGLKGKTLYPIVSSVWGHCEITMRYINGLNRKSDCIHSSYCSPLFPTLAIPPFSSLATLSMIVCVVVEQEKNGSVVLLSGITSGSPV